MLRISQIKLNPEESVSLLPKKIGQKLRIRNFQPKNWKIVKESIDAREKPRIRLIYTCLLYTSVWNPRKKERKHTL